MPTRDRKEYFKEYNKNRASKPKVCECGRTVTDNSMTRHLKSDAHWKAMKSKHLE